MSIFYYGCEAIFNIVKMAMAVYYIDRAASPRYSKGTIYAVAAGTIAVLTSLAIYNLCTAQTTMFSNNLLWLYTAMLSMTVKKLYHIRMLDALFKIYIFWAFLHITDFFLQSLSYCALEFCGGQKQLLLNMGWARGIYLLIIAGAVYLFKEKVENVMKLGKSIENKTVWKIVLIALVSVLLVYFQRIYLEIVTEQYMKNWLMLIMCIMVVMGSLLIYARKLWYEKRDLLQQTQIKLLEENYQQTIEMYKEKSILLHDERHHIQMLNGYIKNGELEKAIDYGEKIYEQLQCLETKVWTNHQTMDLILNMKTQEAKERQISVDFQFEDMTDLRMEDTDICALFLNLLDNSIEANLKIVSGEKRWIKMRGVKKGHILFVQLSNPLHEELRKDGDKLLTTKADVKNHGFGMESVQKVINKYNGELNIFRIGDKLCLEFFVMAIAVK